MAASAAPFPIQETTIAALQAAYVSGRVTAVSVCRTHLDRIAAFDRKGPALGAIIINDPNALADAAALDATLESTGKLVGPLHGIPVLVKDNFDVAGLQTTRDLKMRDPATAECPNLVFGRCGARFQPDPRTQLLAIPFIRDTEHLGVGDGGMSEQEFLDLARIDVLSAADDHVLAPAGDGDVPGRCPVACGRAKQVRTGIRWPDRPAVGG